MIYGYTYQCTCGDLLTVGNGLDDEDALRFLRERVGEHKVLHVLAVRDGTENKG